MAVLNPKYILCSMRCLPCLPLTISLHSPSFTFPLFSPLSSFPSTSSLNVVSDFLTKECGFSSSQVTTLMRRRPALLRKKSDHTAREAIHILTHSGFTENQLKSTILKNPIILELNVDAQLKPKMELLKNLGLAPQNLPRIISRCPRLLNISLEKSFAPRILHLRNLFGSNAYLCEALKRVPGLLTADFDKQVKPKADYVKNNLGISEGSIAFLRALNAAFCHSFETLEKKTKHMTSLGLAEEEVHLMIKSCPQILRTSIKKIKENMDFLIYTAGLMPEIVVSNPVILDFSIEKRLKPRYEVFKSLRTNPHSKRLPSLRTLIKLSEREFLKDFGQYNTQVKSNVHTIS